MSSSHLNLRARQTDLVLIAIEVEPQQHRRQTMKLLIACSDNGSIKELVCNLGTDTSKKDSTQPFYLESSLAEGSKNSVDVWYSLRDSDLMLVARNNGILQLVSRGDELKSLEELKIEFNVSKFELLDFINDDDGLLNNKILEPLFAKSKKRTKLMDSFVTLAPLNSNETKFLLGTKSGLVHIVEINQERRKINKIITHQVKAPLEFVQLYDNDKYDNDKYVFATGGEENLVKLFEMEKDFQKINKIWEAKNVKNDRLDMRVPVWPIALKFLDPLEKPTNKDNALNYQFITITRWSHLGIYQTQHGKKPLRYIDLLPNREPLTNLQLVGNSEQITPLGNLNSSNIDDFTFITTDTKKDILKFNEKGRLLGKYGKADIVGACNFINVYHGDKYLIQGGLDRYLRIFDVTSFRTLTKVYIGSKINFIEVLDEHDIELPELNDKKAKGNKKKRAVEEEEEEEDAEALWNALEDKKSQKKPRV